MKLRSPLGSRHDFTGTLAVLVMLAVSLATTVWAWRSAVAEGRVTAGNRFEFRSKEIQAAIHARMLGYEQVLRGAVGLFAASQSVERDEWRAYVGALNIQDHYPGIQGVGFSLYVKPEEIERQIERIRSEGFPDYRIKPPGQRDEYTAVVYLEPFSGRNLRAFGYDMFSEPTRRAAMTQARDSGQTAISGKVTLVQETDKDVQAGFLMYLPVYRQGAPVASREQRRAALYGRRTGLARWRPPGA